VDREESREAGGHTNPSGGSRGKGHWKQSHLTLISKVEPRVFIGHLYIDGAKRKVTRIDGVGHGEHPWEWGEQALWRGQVRQWDVTSTWVRGHTGPGLGAVGPDRGLQGRVHQS
jgi:hypothetical protein